LEEFGEFVKSEAEKLRVFARRTAAHHESRAWP